MGMPDLISASNAKLHADDVVSSWTFTNKLSHISFWQCHFIPVQPLSVNVSLHFAFCSICSISVVDFLLFFNIQRAHFQIVLSARNTHFLKVMQLLWGFHFLNSPDVLILFSNKYFEVKRQQILRSVLS